MEIPSGFALNHTHAKLTSWVEVDGQKSFRPLAPSTTGTTGIEYGFIAGVVSLAAAAIWNIIGTQLAILSAQIATALGFSGVIVLG